MFLNGYSKLFISVGDAAAAQVVRRQFNRNAISGQNFNIMHSHFAGNVRQNPVIIFKDDSERSILQAFLDNTVNLYGLFLSRT